MITDYNIDIDLKLKPSFPKILKFNQYDRGVYLKINLFDAGEPYIIPDTETPIIEISLPKGKGYIISGSSIKDISSNSFRVAIDRNISLNSGEASFNVSIVDKTTGTTTRKGSFKNYIKILSNSIDEGTTSTELATSIIETLQSNVATATAKETSLLAAIEAGNLDNYATTAAVSSGYVAKETGKGLSTNDFTTAYKTLLDGLTTTIATAILNDKKASMPVGHILPTFNSANPSTYLNFGTWELTATGKTLIGIDSADTDFNTSGKTSGSKTHTHASGSIVADIGAVDSNLSIIAYSGTNAVKTSYGMGISGTALSDAATKTVNHATTTSGSTASASNLPPYIVCYIWKRTA